MKHFFGLFLKLTYYFIFFCFLGLFSLFVRLQIAPIDITFLAQSNLLDLPTDIKGKILLRWLNLKNDPEVFAEQVSLSTPTTQITTDLALNFSIKKLVLGKVFFDYISLYSPQITWAPPHEEGDDKDGGFEPLKNLFDAITPLKIVKHFSIKNGQFHIPLSQKEENAPLLEPEPPTSERQKITFKNINLDCFFTKTLSLKGNFTLNDQKFYITNTTSSQKSETRLKFDHLILSQLPFLKDPLFEHPVLGFPKKGLISLKILKNNESSYALHLTVQEKLNGNDSYSNLLLNLKGSLASNQISYTGGLTLGPINLDQLDLFWPPSLAENARDWITKNLSAGQMTNATLFTSGRYDIKTKTHTFLEEISGFISLSDTTVQYMKDFPPLKHVNAISHFNESGFKISFLKGNIHEIQLQSGELLIEGMLEDLPKAKLSLRIASPLQSTLKLINTKPLSLLESYELDLNKIKGQAHIHLKMGFPLLKDLAFSNVDVNVTADLQNATIEEKLQDQVLSLTQGNYTLKVNKEDLHMEGKTLLNTLPTHITWHSYFYPQKTYSNQYQLKFTSKVDQVPGLDIDFLSKYFPGLINFDLNIKEYANASTSIDVKADLKETSFSLPVMGLIKPEEEPASFYAHVLIKKGSLKHISDLNYKDASGSITADADFNAPDDFKINLRDVSVLANKFSGTISTTPKGGLIAHLKGPLLDLSHLSIFSDDDEHSSSFPDQTVIALNFDQIKLKRDIILEKFLSTYGEKDQKTAYFYASGQFYGRNSFDLKYLFDPKKQHLYFKTSNIGLLARGFDLNSEIYGGKITINAESETPNDPLEGRVDIKDLTIRNIPSIVQILSLASISGLAQMFQGNGYPFSEGYIDFSYKEGTLYLIDSILNGPGVAMTAAGLIDRTQKTLNLTGEVIPFRSINQFLGALPILGTILSGGSPNRGILSFSYQATGSFENPIISSSPLSIFTPQSIKNLITPQTEIVKKSKNSDKP